MKAVIFEKYGPAEVLQLVQLPKPTPKEAEVLVKIHATSVTAEDPKMRGFDHPPLLKLPVGLMFGFNKPRKPVLGIEFAGTIEAVGAKVRSYSVGDQVFGYTGLSFGAYAEYKCMPENGLMHFKPKNFSFEESIGMLNGSLTALAFLKKKGKVKRGDRVLIYGASGSVGTSAVQLAKYFGAKVTGVCSTRNIDLVRSIGADEVIDYTQEDFTQQDHQYDLIFDTVGKTSMKQCLQLLSEKGKYLRTEFGLSHIISSLFSALFKRKKVMIASSNFYWKKEDLILFKQIAEAGKFTPVIDQVFPLEKMVEAHKYVESGRKVGNVSISVQGEELG